MFIEAKVGLRELRGTHVSMRRRRIAGTNPSEDAQSFPYSNPKLACNQNRPLGGITPILLRQKIIKPQLKYLEYLKTSSRFFS
jgi:hypothetical protein